MIEQMNIIRRGDPDQLRELLGKAKGPEDQMMFSEQAVEAVIRVLEDPAAWPALDALLAQEAPDVPEQAWFQLYLLAGREQKALELALKYPTEISVDFIWMPEAANFRRLPGFDSLAQKMGLLDYWKQYGWPDDCRSVGDGMQCGFSSLVAAR